MSYIEASFLCVPIFPFLSYFELRAGTVAKMSVFGARGEKRLNLWWKPHLSGKKNQKEGTGENVYNPHFFFPSLSFALKVGPPCGAVAGQAIKIPVGIPSDQRHQKGGSEGLEAGRTHEEERTSRGPPNSV